MLKLHHVLYITEPDIALKLDGRTVLACHADGREDHVPLHLLQGIVSFSHIPPTQALAKTCAWEGIGFVSFLENGRFQYRIVGASRGNVLLRKRQYLLSEDTAGRVELARSMIQGKIYGASAVLHRYAKNHPELADLTPVEGRLKALAGLASTADEEEDGVHLSLEGCRIVLREWSKMRQREVRLAEYDQTAPLGLMPFLQAQKLARFLRGECPAYTNVDWGTI